MRKRLVRAYELVKKKREAGNISDDDEPYYAALDMLWQQGLYNMDTGELKPLEGIQMEEFEKAPLSIAVNNIVDCVCGNNTFYLEKTEDEGHLAAVCMACGNRIYVN